jgi:hypothetical protein
MAELAELCPPPVLQDKIKMCIMSLPRKRVLYPIPQDKSTSPLDKIYATDRQASPAICGVFWV